MLLAQAIENPVIGQLGRGGQAQGGNILATYIANLWRTMIILGGLALFLFLVWGALEWLLAGGDKAKVESARDRITNAIIGMAILVASVAISIVVSQALNFDLLRPIFPTSGGN